MTVSDSFHYKVVDSLLRTKGFMLRSFEEDITALGDTIDITPIDQTEIVYTGTYCFNQSMFLKFDYDTFIRKIQIEFNWVKDSFNHRLSIEADRIVHDTLVDGLMGHIRKTKLEGIL